MWCHNRGKIKWLCTSNDEILSWYRFHPLEFDGEDEQSCVEMMIIMEEASIPNRTIPEINRLELTSIREIMTWLAH